MPSTNQVSSSNSTQATIEAVTRPTTPEPSQIAPPASEGQGIRREAAYFLRITEDGHYVTDDSHSIPMMDRRTRISVLQVPTRPPSPVIPRSEAFAPRGGLRSHLAAKDLVAALDAVKVTEEAHGTDAGTTADVDAGAEAPTSPAEPKPIADRTEEKGAPLTSPPARPSDVLPTTTVIECGTSGDGSPRAPSPDAPRGTTLKRRRSVRNVGKAESSKKPKENLVSEEKANELPQPPKKRTRKASEKAAIVPKATVAPKTHPVAPATPVSTTRVRPTASARARKVADVAPAASSKGIKALKRADNKLALKGKGRVASKA